MGSNNEKAILEAMPAGWEWVGRSRSGPQGTGGCHVLANVMTGVALVDVAPDATPNAEMRLRRYLASTGFTARFPGVLPVAHVRVERSGLALVQPLLEGCFQAQSSLSITDPGWVPALVRTLESQPAWSQTTPPSALPIAPEMYGEEPSPRPRRRTALLRWGFAGLALAASFVAGLTVGVRSTIEATPGTAAVTTARVLPAQPLAVAPGSTGAASIALPDGPAPSQRSTEPAVTDAPVLATQPTLTEREASPDMPVDASDGDPVRMALPMAPRPEVVTVPPPEPAPSEAQVAALPPDPHLDATAPATSAVRPAPAASDTDIDLPTPGSPPVRPRPVASRRTVSIEPACAEAVLRYQQGLALTWAEMAYVRNGCRTVVRR